MIAEFPEQIMAAFVVPMAVVEVKITPDKVNIFITGIVKTGYSLTVGTGIPVVDGEDPEKVVAFHW
jgi:hypothetical protein